MSKNDYIANYNKKNYFSFLIRISNKETELIEKINSVDSKNGYLVSLIKEDVHPNILKLSYIKSVSKDVLSRYGITKIYLFGSYARGEANANSDVDIMCDQGNITTLIEKETLIEELENRLHKKVDLIFTTSSLPDYFKSKIEEDLIELC